MPKSTKQRSVGVQSTDSVNSETRAQPARLVKKSGFRNLVQKSVKIDSQNYEEEMQGLSLPGEPNSKSVQTALDGELSFQRFRSGGQNLEFPHHRMHSPGRDNESRTTNSEMLKVVEPGARTSNPGTSRMMPTAFSSASVNTPQVNEVHFNRREGSLAVVYNYGEKSMRNSISSSLGFFYGSQGSRRFSDETVLLIEDYQSYDHTNVARRQDVEFSRRRNLFPCCRKIALSSSVEMLTRPLPLAYDDLLERDEIVCRICHEGEDVEPLIQPCLCKVPILCGYTPGCTPRCTLGSIGSVHAKCLKNWLEQSNTSRCELCNYPYAIRQSKKYTKCYSVKVFYETVIDRRAMAYDVISFVVITPLTLVGVVMCIQASVISSDSRSNTNYQMGYITKAGMIMLSGTIMVAYGVWLYTLISYHYKSWKKWYSNCYDVEVLPVRMTSEERLEAARRLSEEMNRRQLSREQPSTLVTILHSPRNYSFYQRRVTLAPAFQHDR